MTQPLSRTIHANELSQFIDIIATGFKTTAISNAFLVELDNVPPPYPSPQLDSARRRRMFANRLEEQAKDGAVQVEAGDWSAVASWEAPDFPYKPASGELGLLRSEWFQRVMDCKARHLGGPAWHLGFLARNPDKPVVPGAIRAVLQPFIDKAQAAELPCWLEATNPRAVKVYERFGFKVVEELVFGRGKINAEGWPEEGGQGVTGYAMLLK